MSFPNYPEKHGNISLLRADDIVAYRSRLGRMLNMKAPQGVLFCLERGLPDRMRWRIPVQKAGSMNADVHTVKRAKKTIAILTNFGGGSPIVVELAEEMAVMGAKKMILMTWGGLLQPDLHPGDIIVCNQAIRDDGASHHYLPPEKYIGADNELAQQLVEEILARGKACTLGASWTTDAPYRETEAEVRQYQSEGVKTVEMESAGLFTVGKVRGVKTASIIVGMDSLATYKWQVPERLDAIQHALEIVYAAAIDVLQK